MTRLADVEPKKKRKKEKEKSHEYVAGRNGDQGKPHRSIKKNPKSRDSATDIVHDLTTVNSFQRTRRDLRFVICTLHQPRRLAHFWRYVDHTSLASVNHECRNHL